MLSTLRFQSRHLAQDACAVNQSACPVEETLELKKAFKRIVLNRNEPYLSCSNPLFHLLSFLSESVKDLGVICLLTGSLHCNADLCIGKGYTDFLSSLSELLLDYKLFSCCGSQRAYRA